MASPYKKMLEQCAARDRRILELYRGGLRMVEIARRHGITKQRVSKILARVNGK